MSPSLNLAQFKTPATPMAATTPVAVRIPASKEAIKQQRRNEVLLNIESLPSLPTIVNEVVKMASSEETEAKDFEAPFRKDQTLTAKLLKLVNSNFYALPNKVTTVKGSIVILGFKTIKSLVLACGASATLSRPVKTYGYDEGGLWKHSLATAALSRHLAINYLKMKPNDAEELFVAGLLHDIGKIAIVPELEKHEKDMWSYWEQHPTSDISVLEREFLGIDHSEVGSLITEKWNLDGSLNEIITGHHQNDYKNEAVAAVSLANLLATRTGLGLSEEYAWKRPIPKELMEAMGINKDEIAQLKKGIKKVIVDSMEMLGSLN